MEDVKDQTKIKLEHLELPSIRFHDRLVFDDGQHRVELIKYGQAHTKGDGVAYLPAEGIVFVGDLAVNWTHGNNLSDQDVSISVGFAHSTTLPSSPSRPWFRHTEISVMLICCIASGTLLPTCGNRSSKGLKAGKSSAELKKTVQLTQHGIFAADPQETEDTIESMCDRARTQPDWNSGNGNPE